MSLFTFNESKLRWLVVGADGLIGHAVYAMLKSHGVNVLGTSRRVNSEFISIDLAAPSCEWSLPVCDIALLCAGVTRIVDCKTNPHASYYLNVQAQLALAECIWRRGGFVVYLSSNSVFDSVPEVPAVNTPLAPNSVYGYQKARAEILLSQASAERGLAIIRMTKILARQTSLLRNWEASLAVGTLVFPHARRWMAPLHISMVASGILTIAAAMQSGIWHISAEEDISYADFALMWATAMGYSDSLVSHCYNDDLLSSRTRLNMDSTTQHFGIRAPSISDVICSLIEERGRSSL